MRGEGKEVFGMRLGVKKEKKNLSKKGKKQRSI